ncbi:hypothetical protein [Brevibacterium marinum]|uniref:Multisubunit Na+/H+ antiporter MnhB subunit n=1 Tax=Brevibacterium marinum TaxID=418643 RepID=A0A846S3S1_9MICO|nr:hypothetical protein [Brevibacterium marinum]NJC55517.1 multisubunit Na+/H+ antiporter MnhB subunit [Brevibacterium marinum]
MTKLLFIGGTVLVILGGLLAGGGWFFNTFTGEPADANIGAGIMVPVGCTIVGPGVLVLLAWAIAAGFRFWRRRRTT